MVAERISSLFGHYIVEVGARLIIGLGRVLIIEAGLQLPVRVSYFVLPVLAGLVILSICYVTVGLSIWVGLTVRLRN